MNCITSFLWHFFILFSLKYERKIIPSYNETLRACFTVVKSKFFYFFSYESSCEFFNTTRKKLVILNFSVKKKSIWNWIHTLYDYWNFISFLIQQTVKETIGVGVNEKAALSSDKNCPFVYINFDFTLVNKVASL